MRAFVKKLDPAAVVPTFKNVGDAGADLVCIERVELAPGQRADVATGLALEAPIGCWFDIRPRSSTLRTRGLLVHQGTIDQGYRGPLFVYVWNVSERAVIIEPGDRLAQIVFMPLTRPQFEVVAELSETDRGERGFGSTGLSG